MCIDLKVVVIVLTAVAVVVRCAGNATAAAPAAPAKAPPAIINHPPGALASFGKMLIDIPLGIVEACKDGVAAIEKAFLAIVRGIF